MLERFCCSTASAFAHAENDVGVFQITGLVTPAVQLQLLRHSQDWVEHSDIHAQVAVYRDTVMAIDSDSMLANAKKVIAPSGALAIPAALVVSQDCLELFDRYCRLMGRQGIVRLAFTSMEHARRWAAEEAAVYRQHHEAYHRVWPRLPAAVPAGQPSTRQAAHPSEDRPASLRVEDPTR